MFRSVLFPVCAYRNTRLPGKAHQTHKLSLAAEKRRPRCPWAPLGTLETGLRHYTDSRPEGKTELQPPGTRSRDSGSRSCVRITPSAGVRHSHSPWKYRSRPPRRAVVTSALCTPTGPRRSNARSCFVFTVHCLLLRILIRPPDGLRDARTDTGGLKQRRNSAENLRRLHLPLGRILGSRHRSRQDLGRPHIDCQVGQTVELGGVHVVHTWILTLTCGRGSDCLAAGVPAA